MYQERMIGYYSQVIAAIEEFKAIIDAEYPEMEELDDGKTSTINDAYLITMGEDRIKSWEKILNIAPLAGSSLDDRRDTIIARIRGQGKLNTALISSIVNAFTGGTANSYIEDSVLYVEITPPPNNKQYQFANVEQELKKKAPAHLGLNVSRHYSTWGQIKEKFASWDAIKSTFTDWEEVKLYIVTTSNVTTLAI